MGPLRPRGTRSLSLPDSIVANRQPMTPKRHAHHIPEKARVYILPTTPNARIEDSIVFVQTGNMGGKSVQLMAFQQGLVGNVVCDATKPVVLA